jgi:ABC-type Na+ efflux pump permease subunit
MIKKIVEFVFFMLLAVMSVLGFIVGVILYPFAESFKDAQEYCRENGWPPRLLFLDDGKKEE